LVKCPVMSQVMKGSEFYLNLLHLTSEKINDKWQMIVILAEIQQVFL